jgi:malate synthase
MTTTARPATTPQQDASRTPTPAGHDILSSEARAFLTMLERKFRSSRASLLAEREERQRRLDAGERPVFPASTRAVREDPAWSVAPVPRDLQRRRVEITGPVERKMMINALNSGADVFMADFEDANAPTWNNVLQGQANLIDAVNRTISHTAPDGKTYLLRDNPATLLVRPRGWHLPERHFMVDDAPMSASLFDFGLYFFHNARTLLGRGTGPYFYLPKLESHREARLWNDVFQTAQDALGIPRGSIRATVLIETILAAFEMEEILYELREHCAGLNAGRWDYIFSIIKKFRRAPVPVFPDRAGITMTVPFMRAYTRLLVDTCHRRGAHAIGGMAAFIPSRRDPDVNARALAQVTADKERESGDGFDGTWVAHPDLVPVALAPFGRVLGDRPHQKDRRLPAAGVTADQLLDFHIPGGEITETGVRNNINVAIQYLEAWLSGSGAVAIFNLMEDVATAEIARSQLWQWIHRPEARLSDGTAIDPALYRKIRDEELERIRKSVPEARVDGSRLDTVVELLDTLILDDRFHDFLTLEAYPHLNGG